MPKSDTFGFISASNKTLLAFRSRCITLSRESSWRYKIPRAIPPIILWRFDQSSSPCFSGSVRSVETNNVIILLHFKKEYFGWYITLYESHSSILRIGDYTFKTIEKKINVIGHTKQKIIKAFVGYKFIDKQLFSYIQAKSQKPNKISVLKLGYQYDLVFKFYFTLPRTFW